MHHPRIIKEYTKRLLPDFAAWEPLHHSIQNNYLPNTNKVEFVEAVMKRFEEIKQEVDFCVQWAQTIYSDDLLAVPNDTMMATLRQAAGKGAESPEHWKQLRAIWSGHELGANPTKPHSGKDVADHHAKLILEEALAQ